MDAIKFLLKEHNEIRRRFAKIMGLPAGDKKTKLFNELCLFLIRHETMEQKLWYPNFRSKLKPLVQHLMAEEKSSEKFMLEFEKAHSEEEWEGDLLDLQETVDHHASQEENELFPQVAQILDKAKLNEIGKLMRAFKKKVSQ